jgi:hypothetical protein
MMAFFSVMMPVSELICCGREVESSTLQGFYNFPEFSWFPLQSERA